MADMTRQSPARLGALRRLAGLRSDLELARFAAIGAEVGAVDARAARLRIEMIEVAEGAASLWDDRGGGTPPTLPAGDGAGPPSGIPQDRAAMDVTTALDDRLTRSRLSHALTRAIALEREDAAAQRARLAPRFEAARRAALLAFGKAQVLDQLRQRAIAARRG